MTARARSRRHTCLGVGFVAEFLLRLKNRPERDGALSVVLDRWLPRVRHKAGCVIGRTVPAARRTVG